jgi:glucosamine-6-phosphate deaminase
MEIIRCQTKPELGQRAADIGARCIREAIARKGSSTIVVPTGASQFEMHEALVREPGIDWSKVTAFHLDEYIGIPISHPASFRKFLSERFVRKLPVPLQEFHYIAPEQSASPREECGRLNNLIRAHEIDVAFVGIGENGHLAFNDPPADFETDDPYLVVDLDDACRRQQLGEGWFPTFDNVPKQAISMSIKQILKARSIVCTVPDARKADAVRNSVKGPMTNKVPASVLQTHSNTTLLLDPDSSGLL